MSTPLSAPGESASSALALVNSRHAARTGPADQLETSAAARRWLVRHRLLPGDAQVSAADLAHLHALREAVRRLFEARATGTVGARDDLALVNSALARGRVDQSLRWPAGRLPYVTPEPTARRPMSAAMALLALDAIDTLTGPAGAALMTCAADGCIRLLLRDHGHRRWCSTRCGARVRAARHYRRTHAGASVRSAS